VALPHGRAHLGNARRRGGARAPRRPAGWTRPSTTCSAWCCPAAPTPPRAKRLVRRVRRCRSTRASVTTATSLGLFASDEATRGMGAFVRSEAEVGGVVRPTCFASPTAAASTATG
jgi:hypothetical protein